MRGAAVANELWTNGQTLILQGERIDMQHTSDQAVFLHFSHCVQPAAQIFD